MGMQQWQALALGWQRLGKHHFDHVHGRHPCRPHQGRSPRGCCPHYCWAIVSLRGAALLTGDVAWARIGWGLCR